MRRIVVGISGASGAVYGVRVLEVLAGVDDVETHLILSKGATTTLLHETGLHPEALSDLADVTHDERSLGATIASGSFRTHAMVVAPCSMKTLGAIANSYSDNLITRAADVCLKERRPLVLVVREAPLHLGHLRLMTAVTEAGAIVFPPVTAFYIRPTGISEIVDHTVMRVLDQIGVETDLVPRWDGVS